jgi:hypothetical protein
MKELSMIRPKIYPGEIDMSYLGAVMRMNGLRNEESTIALMVQSAGVSKWTRRTAPVIELLSEVAGVPMEPFVHQHSTLGFRRAITANQLPIPHGAVENRVLLSSHGMRRTRNAAYFCVDCVIADQSELDRSYWRREHQIPGLYWCPKHRVDLRCTDSDHAFLKSPSDFIDSTATMEGDWVAESRSSKPVMRFLDICSALIDAKSPFMASRISDALARRATAAGYRSHFINLLGARVKEKELLSSLIHSTFPQAWLTREFPEFRKRRVGQIVGGIDGFSWFAGIDSSAICALVASVLFPSADA